MIAPYDSSKHEIFDRVWNFDLENGLTAIGWSEVGDPSQLTKNQLKEKFGGSLSSFDLSAVWSFYHEISVGDVIMARRGTKRVIGVGNVRATAFYDEVKGRQRIANLVGDFSPNFIGVSWEEKEIDFEKQVFTFQTLSEISGKKYMELVLRITPQAKQQVDVSVDELSREEYTILQQKGIDADAFRAQLLELGFSQAQATNAIRLLARICLKDPSFFDSRTRSGTIKSAMAYSVYSYLVSNNKFGKSVLNERKIAAHVSLVAPQSFRYLTRRIMTEFGGLFPDLFGGRWDEHLLRTKVHEHLWVSKGPAFPVLQAISNEDYRRQYNKISWSDNKINLRRAMVEQQCSICKRVRQHARYNELDNRWNEYSCPNPKCKDYGVRGGGNIRFGSAYEKGRRGARLVCVSCHAKFADTQGSPLYDMRIGIEKLRQIIELISEGRSLRSIAKETRAGTETVRRIIKLSEQDREKFTKVMLDKLQLTEKQCNKFWAART